MLRYDDLAGHLRKLRHSLLIVDIAVPRDVDPRLEDLPDVFLYNIDDLDSRVAETLARRRLEVPNAEAIVHWEVDQFAEWLDSRQVVPTIRQLQERFRTLQAEEIERYGGKFSDKDRAELEKFTEAFCRKILHGPISLLRGLSGNGAGSDDLVAVDLIRSIFDLDSRSRIHDHIAHRHQGLRARHVAGRMGAGRPPARPSGPGGGAGDHPHHGRPRPEGPAARHRRDRPLHQGDRVGPAG